ncbi:MAG TPA: single-stranded-DNA-specific exonuclease RecJ [Candidatus Angelobacter sp.]|jgi:single-stranded-DNA-specific exonuclease|nr:single-stranded-DNA-specific exonuclease RecJ [Candidatus Angelobacter sp.]
MSKPQMRWSFSSPDAAQVAALRAEAKVSPIVARLLALRGIAVANAERFLSPSLDHLHSPYLMRGMTAAVERLSAAIANKEEILIYGDYDVDGTTAVVILKTAIELCGGAADFHVPHRIKEGYGIKDDVIERAAAGGIRVVISVDTGIRAFRAVETARRVGIDLIVTDHHLPEAHEGVPNAWAVLNPNQQGCDYPCKELCGAGVAFKIAQALFAKFKDALDQAKFIPSFLKMVAIATIADAVPLVGENRTIARLGLEGLRRPVNGGLKALMEVSGLTGDRAIGAGDVGFRLGPRINAAGRMDVARDVIELFTCKDPARCKDIAEKLNQLNLERQSEEQRIVAEIEQQLAVEPDLTGKFCMVFDGDGWHRGVVGIVASRVVEKTGRPALVIAKEGEEAHGSGRSISAFHLLDALENCHDLFTRFGGHAHAVGFAMPSRDVPALKQRLNSYAQAKLTPEDLIPRLGIDAEIPLSSVTPELLNSLGRLEPFGHGNREPVFASCGVSLLLPPRILKEKHIKLRVNQKRPDVKASFNYEAVGWRMAERAQAEALHPGDTLDLAYKIGLNFHPDFGGLELTLEDFRKSGPAAISVCG